MQKSMDSFPTYREFKKKTRLSENNGSHGQAFDDGNDDDDHDGAESMPTMLFFQ